MEKLDGKIVVMTGAGYGLGKTISKYFAKRSALIVVSDIILSSANETLNQVKEEGGDGIALCVDVGDLKAVDKMISKTVEYENMWDQEFFSGKKRWTSLYHKTKAEKTCGLALDRILKHKIKLSSRLIQPYSKSAGFLAKTVPMPYTLKPNGESLKSVFRIKRRHRNLRRVARGSLKHQGRKSFRTHDQPITSEFAMESPPQS